MRAALVFIAIHGFPGAGAAPAVDRLAAPAVDEVVIRRLIEALSDPDLDVRQNLAVALAKIGSAGVTQLNEALKDKNADRRAGAAYALGLIGPGARVALPNLLDLLKDDDVGVRRQAAYAIGRIVPAGRPAASLASTPPPASGGSK